jgi:CheY-like chemotaxis protein
LTTAPTTWCRTHCRRLVLLDLHLPGIDGEEVLRRLQADPRTAGPPVVVVSAEVTRSGTGSGCWRPAPPST